MSRTAKTARPFEGGTSGTGAGGALDHLELGLWPIERLIPSARNARTHSDSQVAEIP
jgi:hypothetical protein